MQASRIIPSITSDAASIGREAARHLDLLWRDMMKSQGSIESETFFRLITSQEHPLGNLAILRESSDARVVEEAVAPLKDISKPAAVLFVAGIRDAVSEELAAQGFSKIEPMPAMAVDIPSLPPTRPPEGYDFVKVSSAEVGTAWADVVTAGFEIPRGLAPILFT